MRSRMLAAFAVTMLAVPTAGCHRQQASPWADRAWVRLPAVPGRPGAAYLTIHGGKRPARLIAVETAAAGSSELHESMTMGPAGMTGMKRLDDLDVPAGGEVAFAPGGNHVMLFGLDPALRAGATIPLSLKFERGHPVAVTARIVAAGDAAPY